MTEQKHSHSAWSTAKFQEEGRKAWSLLANPELEARKRENPGWIIKAPKKNRYYIPDSITDEEHLEKSTHQLEYCIDSIPVEHWEVKLKSNNT